MLWLFISLCDNSFESEMEKILTRPTQPVSLGCRIFIQCRILCHHVPTVPIKAGRCKVAAVSMSKTPRETQPESGPSSPRESAAPRALALLISGASGGGLAPRLAKVLLEHASLDTLHLVVTSAAQKVLRIELGRAFSTPEGLRDMIVGSSESASRVLMWDDADLTAPISSGSYPLIGTVVLPCSAGMAGAMANGISRGLVQRAADVALKQRWPLIVGIRETPMSQILLRNLLVLAQAGAHIVPPIPAFYLTPDPALAMERYIDHYCVRVLDILGISLEAKELRWRA